MNEPQTREEVAAELLDELKALLEKYRCTISAEDRTNQMGPFRTRTGIDIDFDYIRDPAGNLLQEGGTIFFNSYIDTETEPCGISL